MKKRFTITSLSHPGLGNRKITWLFIFSILMSASISAQWNQLGAGINGEADEDYSGISVSLAADGSTLAIGAFGNDGGGNNRGHVRMYRNVCGMWTQEGDDIDGEADDDNSGWSVSVSGDGSTVAIGALNNDAGGLDRGHVRVYKNMGGTWTQLGSDLDGEADGDNYGVSTSLSTDGTTVAIGGYINAGGGSYRGHVRVHKYVSGSWLQLGTDIEGEGDYDTSGESVALSADGYTVAIGAIGNAGSGFLQGHVRVFNYQDGVWSQVGADIDGEADLDFSGKSVSLSADGTILAVGSPFNFSSGSFGNGYVKVYKNVSGNWVQQGTRIDGEADGDYSGISVSLSADGSKVAIGGYYNNGGGFWRGHVRVFKNVAGSWIQQGLDIDGLEDEEHSGLSVSLSADGTAVATAGPYHSGGGYYRGQARVYSTNAGGGDDSDCDGVGDACDVCPGGDDTIDNDEDGMPDCANLPLYSDIINNWKCGNQKVLMAHHSNNACNTLCVSYASAQTHLNHGDYLGPCDAVGCNNGYAIHKDTGTSMVDNAQSEEFPNDDVSVAGFEIAPNPASDFVEMHFPVIETKGNLKIFNSSGEEIWHGELEPGNKQMRLQTKHITGMHANGLYFAVLEYGEQILVKTISILD